MFAKSFTLALSGLALASCASSSTAPAPQSRAEFPPEKLLTSCESRDGWSDAAPPARLHGSTYYVGTCGITALLIDSGDGLILIDAATEEAAPAVLDNIRTLGFDPKDIRILLASHEHFDHSAGLAAIQQASGAPLLTIAEAAEAHRSGKPNPSDPQADILDPAPPLRVEASLVSGQAIRLGHVAITPHSTPVHTLGSLSYTWQSCEDGACKSMAFMDSLSTPPNKYRFTDHPDQISRVLQGFDKAAEIRCEYLITPHPSASSLFDRLRGQAPLTDGEACTRYTAAARQTFEHRLVKEKQ
jgi:metallo-beta-lactamase class B